MSDRSDRGPQVSLEIRWGEGPTDPSTRRDGCWEELAAGMHRLLFLVDEFDSVQDIRDTRSALERLCYHVESYLHRAYELRERAFLLLAAVAGEKKLCDPNKRWRALARMDQVGSASVKLVVQLVQQLSDDIKDRNRHTHETFLTLQVRVDDALYDLDSTLFEVERRPEQTAKVRRTLRHASRRLAQQYRNRIRALVESTLPLLNRTDPWATSTPPQHTTTPEGPKEELYAIRTQRAGPV